VRGIGLLDIKDNFGETAVHHKCSSRLFTWCASETLRVVRADG
jgi:hypothetical protein